MLQKQVLAAFAFGVVDLALGEHGVVITFP